MTSISLSHLFTFLSTFLPIETGIGIDAKKEWKSRRNLLSHLCEFLLRRSFFQPS